MSVSSGRSAGGCSRVLSKLNSSLENGNFYEAHQMYRTLYFRYTGQKKYAEVEKLLWNGASKLFDKDQGGSGADLSKLYLDNLATAQMKPDEDIMKKIVKLYISFPANSPDKDAFLSQAIKWTSSKEYRSGHPRLHQLLAYEFWKAKRYPEARHHFLYSSDGYGCGCMLAEFHSERGFLREIDLFVVGTVLQFLCLRKHIPAAYALKSYTDKHPSIAKGPPFKHPLINFVWLLLLAIEHKQSLNVFSTLLEQYKPSLRRDPVLMEYLDKIGQNFFGVPPPRKQASGGMFSGIFDSLMSAFTEDDDDNGDDTGASSLANRSRPSTSGNATANAETKMTTEDLD